MQKNNRKLFANRESLFPPPPPFRTYATKRIIRRIFLSSSPKTILFVQTQNISDIIAALDNVEIFTNSL